jgi:alkanesulfonate monooxygenase SsuD/methylene tetrahydromethanopterin reductase-like flavin-dependent oxidoreductase (luciferase family)
MMATKIDDWQLIAEAENLGYDSAWVPDSQMIWSDCYATLALAAFHTSRIRLGTGVAIPGTRIAPVTAHSIASIHRLAPGRTFLGIGTGHTAMRVMGMGPMPIRQFREYLRVVRALLDGEEVEYTQNGVTRTIRFLHRDLGFVRLEPRIPIYLAANGPRALELAGEVADGLISVAAERPEHMARNLERLEAGAARARRRLPSDFHTASLTTAVILRPGEPVDSERVIDEVGSQVTASLHFWYEIWRQTGDDAVIPEAFADVWEAYCESVERMETPREKRYLQIHEGHCTYLVPAERRFVTARGIRAAALVGEPDEIVEQIRAAERAGLREVVLLPPMAYARKVFREFAEHVIRRFR